MINQIHCITLSVSYSLKSLLQRNIVHCSLVLLKRSCSVRINNSLQAGSLGCSGVGAGKGRRAYNYISGIWISASKKSMQKCWLADMTLVMMSLPLAHVFPCLLTFALISTSRCLAEIWQLSCQGATGELEVEFIFQRRSCKFSFLFPPCCQSTPESSLTG